MRSLASEPLFFILLFYGLSFVTMAFVVWRASARAAPLPLASSFFLIALFGLTHGVTELLDWLTFVWTTLAGTAPPLRWASTSFLLVSFIVLLQFGLTSLFTRSADSAWFKRLPFVIGALFVIAILATGITDAARVGLLARRAFGFTGAALSAIGFFFSLAPTMKALDDGRLVKALMIAGAAFAAYSVFGGLLVQPVFGLPIQLFRCVCAIVIAGAVSVAARSMAAYKMMGAAP